MRFMAELIAVETSRRLRTRNTVKRPREHREFIKAKPRGLFRRWAAATVGIVMVLDDYSWRPITFQGVTFPATLMGISILDPVLDTSDEELHLWLWRFPNCCGSSKSAPAEECARCAQRAVDLMLEQRQRVLDGICDRLSEHGFDPETTYLDWVLALQRIVELSKATVGECEWSAPGHDRDGLRTEADLQQLAEGINRAGAETSWPAS